MLLRLSHRNCRHTQILGYQVKIIEGACTSLIAVWLFCGPASAGPYATGELVHSKDSDQFHIDSYGAGFGVYTSGENFYERVGFSRSSLHFAAPGFSMHGNSTAINIASIMKLQSSPIKGEAELTSLELPGWATTTGSLQISGQAAQTVNYEVRAEKNYVDSVNSLSRHVTYDAMTFAADYEITPRLNVAGVLGSLSFSDRNRRALLKAKASYVLSEELGIRTYLKLSRHSNTLPYTGNYFSPDKFHDYQVGLGFRRRLSALRGVLSGYVERGSQSADGVSTPVHGEQLRLEAFPNRPWHFDLAAGIQTSAGTGGGTNYEYRYARASVVWPF